MDRKEIKKIVSSLAGQWLLPEDYKLVQLTSDIGDRLIFKEWLDMDFQENFNTETILACDTVADLVELIYKVKHQSAIPADNSTSQKEDENLPEDIGFLIVDLSADQSQPIQWKDLPSKTKELLGKVFKENGIDPSKATITAIEEKNLFIGSYADPAADYSAVFVFVNDRLVFEYEN